MKTLRIFAATLALAFSAKAQVLTNPPTLTLDTNNPPTIAQGFATLKTAILDSTNLLFVPYTLYAPGLQKKWGGGVGAFYSVNQYVETGVRIDYVDGGFWMPQGNATVKLPIDAFTWLRITPFTYAGIGVPLSGATISGIQVPGQTLRNNNGQATAILGAGVAVRLGSIKGRNFGILGDVEKWTGFPKSQYRLGFYIPL